MDGKHLYVAIIVLFVLEGTRSEPLTDVLTAVTNVIGYYDSNYKDLNLDGFFGLRVLEGQLQVLLAEIQSGHIKNVSTTLVKTLQTHHSTCSRISRVTLSYTENDDPEYYRQMAFIVDHPWTLTGDIKPIKAEYKWDASTYKTSRTVSLDEQTSDMCMSELIGAGGKQACQISETCVDIMTYPGLTGYGITHQVLWTMLAEKANCVDSLSKVLSKTRLGNLSRMREEFCVNNYYEMKMLVDDYHYHNVPPVHQDLFMEQQFICPSIGYVEFLNLEYLQWIISWQKDSGCYGKMEREVSHGASHGKVPFKMAMDFDDYYEDSDKKDNAVEIDGNSNKWIIDKKQRPADQRRKDSNIRENKKLNRDINNMKSKGQLLHQSALDNQPEMHNKDEQLKFAAPVRTKRNVANARGLLWSSDPLERTDAKGTQRKLLSEKEMHAGCLSHKTAVASGALMTYLRYLILAQDSMQNITIGQQYTVIHEATNSRSLLNNVNNAQVDLKQFIQQGEDRAGNQQEQLSPQDGGNKADRLIHKYRDDVEQNDVLNNNDAVDDFPLKRVNIPKDPDEKLYRDYQNQEGNILHGGDRDGLKVKDVDKEHKTPNNGDDDEEEDYYDEDEDDYDDEDEDDEEDYDDDNDDEYTDDSKLPVQGHGKIKSSKKSLLRGSHGNFKDEYYDDNGDEGLDDRNKIKNGGSVREHDDQTNSNNDEYTYYEDVDHKNMPRPSIKNKKRKAVKFAETMNIPVKLENVKVSTRGSSRTSYIVIFVMTLILLFLFIRFIRKRRIHVRYSSTSFFKF